MNVREVKKERGRRERESGNDTLERRRGEAWGEAQLCRCIVQRRERVLGDK